MARSDVRAAAVPSFPRAPVRYDQEDNDQFRASLEQVLLDIAHSIESVSSGVFTLDEFGVATLVSGIVIGEAQDVASQMFGTTIVFSATAFNKVQWSSGTITMQDGATTFSIVSGNTGNMNTNDLRFIGLDIAVSTTVLQVSTTLNDFVGDGRILMGWAKKTGTGSAGRAAFVPTIGQLGLSEDNMSANMITASAIQGNTITGIHINGTTLSAIFADLGTVTAGTISANVIVAADSFTAANASFTGNMSIVGNLEVSANIDFLNNTSLTFHDIGGTTVILSPAANALLCNKKFIPNALDCLGVADFKNIFRHSGAGGWAFNGETASGTQAGYTTFTNLATDRTLNANSTTVEELADVLGTLIEDLKTKGVLAA